MMGGVTDPGYNVRREAETAKAQNNPPSPRFCLIAFSRLRFAAATYGVQMHNAISLLD